MITWNDLDAFEQLALDLLLEGDESLLTPNAGQVYDSLIAKGLAGRNWNDVRGMYFALTDAGLKVFPAKEAVDEVPEPPFLHVIRLRKEVDALQVDLTAALARAQAAEGEAQRLRDGLKALRLAVMMQQTLDEDLASGVLFSAMKETENFFKNG